MHNSNVSYVAHLWPLMVKAQYGFRTRPPLQIPLGPLNKAYSPLLEPQSIGKVSLHGIIETHILT